MDRHSNLPRIPYGSGGLPVPWPATRVRQAIEPAPERRPPLDRAALRERLAAAVEALGCCRTVAIVVPDLTRCAGAEQVLPPLLDLLEQRGVEDRNVRAVVALGIHRPLTEAERTAVVGREAAARIAVADHDCRAADLVDLGATAQGIPVRLNRTVAEADGVLLVGTIAFHYVAGYGGARKLLVPGVAAFETAVAAHRRMLDPVPGRGWHPCCRPGVLEGNPVHACMEEASRRLPNVAAVTTILDDARRVVAVHLGTPAESLAAAVEDYDARHRIQMREAAQAIVAGAGGFPRDINMIQAHKALAHARGALAPGGVLVLVAECREGMGYPTFPRWFDTNDPAELEALLRTPAYEINGQTAYSILRTTTEHPVLLVSSLPAEDVRRMRMVPVGSLEEAGNWIERRLGNHWECTVIPSAGAVLPDLSQ